MAQYDFTGLMDETTVKERKSSIPKSLYKLWGAEITPEMKAERPYLSALTKTAQEGIATPLLHFLNMSGGGIPEVLAGKYGYTMPPAGENLPSKIATGIADIAGFAGGIPMRIGGGISRVIPQATKSANILKKMGIGAAKGATEFGIASGLHTPQGSWGNLKGRALRAGLGAVGGAATGTVGGLVEHFTGLLSDKALLKTGDETRAGYKSFRTKLTTWFGGKLRKFQQANPDVRVDISEPIKKFEEEVADKSRYKSLFNSSPRLRNATLKAAKGEGLTLGEAQDLVNQLESTVSEGALSGFKVRPSTGEVTNFIGSLRGAITDTFPQMKYSYKVYKLMNSYTNAIENYMKFGKTVKGIKEMVRNPETKMALKTILPQETFDTLIQTSTAQTITKEGLRALDYLVRYGILYTFMKNVIDSSRTIGGGGLEDVEK